MCFQCPSCCLHLSESFYWFLFLFYPFTIIRIDVMFWNKISRSRIKKLVAWLLYGYVWMAFKQGKKKNKREKWLNRFRCCSQMGMHCMRLIVFDSNYLCRQIWAKTYVYSQWSFSCYLTFASFSANFNHNFDFFLFLSICLRAFCHVLILFHFLFFLAYFWFFSSVFHPLSLFRICTIRYVFVVI